MIKSLWKDPVWSKVIATGILALLTYLGAYLLGLSPAIIAFFAQSWGFFTATSSVPNWLIGLMTIPCLVLGWALVVELKSRMSAEVTEPVNWNSYQRDNFFGLLWGWRYSGNSIEGLHSLCPNCEYQVLPRDVSSYIAVPRFECKCEDCGYSAGSFKGEPRELLHKVELKIQKELRTGNWVKK
jgi:hypothetical protein